MRLSGTGRIIAAAVVVWTLSNGMVLAHGGHSALNSGGGANDGQTSIIYDAATGEVRIDAPVGVGLTAINVDSAGAVFTGSGPAMNLDGQFDIFTADTIFKATFGSEFGSISFGNVASTGLSEAFVLNDFSVDGSLAVGGGLGNVDLIYVPEPSTVVLLGIGMAGAVALMWRHSRAS